MTFDVRLSSREPGPGDLRRRLRRAAPLPPAARHLYESLPARGGDRVDEPPSRDGERLPPERMGRETRVLRLDPAPGRPRIRPRRSLRQSKRAAALQP